MIVLLTVFAGSLSPLLACPLSRSNLRVGHALAQPPPGTPLSGPHDEPRPSESSVQASGQRLLRAIVEDDPQLAAELFFPRDAFVQVKAMQRPERYYDKLHARFQKDIHALHRALPELSEAVFVKLELGRRGGLVRPGEEGNRLPYWAARHARLHYRVGSQARSLELRVLISWQQRWYVIHLCEFQ
ncbi:MAG: hypothetical protein JWN48_3805 [Myxococcaceae bacterium]|nr:hypothetical protein [Myxococcaceae bacterium]